MVHVLVPLPASAPPLELEVEEPASAPLELPPLEPDVEEPASAPLELPPLEPDVEEPASAPLELLPELDVEEPASLAPELLPPWPASAAPELPPLLVAASCAPPDEAPPDELAVSAAPELDAPVSSAPPSAPLELDAVSVVTGVVPPAPLPLPQAVKSNTIAATAGQRQLRISSISFPKRRRAAPQTARTGYMTHAAIANQDGFWHGGVYKSPQSMRALDPGGGHEAYQGLRPHTLSEAI